MPLTTLTLPAPRAYFPLPTGRYLVEAGLKILGQQPVEGQIETQFFPIDSLYGHYLSEKRASRRELPKHYLTARLAPEIAQDVADWIMDRLCLESPEFFQCDGLIFRNRLAGWEAELDPAGGKVVAFRHLDPLLPEAQGDDDFTGCDVLDFLASQLSEDLAITLVDPVTRENWLGMLHVSFPNHWSPGEKIGKDFMAVHEPVADFERVGRASDKLLDATIARGPFIRFAWGVSTDTQLNHHPDAPPGRALEREDPDYVGANTYLRIERQTLQGFPAHHASLFTIRTTFRPLEEIARDPQQRELLRQAIATMSPEALVYKGLTKLQDPLLRYLS